MTTLSKTKSHFQQLLSEIYARQSRKNNQEVCIDCLKSRSNKNKFECKNCGCTEFYVFHYQNSSFKMFKPHFDAIDYFQELPFYNKPIEKLKVKRLKNIDPLADLPFYEQLSVIKTNQAFTGYAMSYKVERIERKDLIVQLEVSKSSIKDLFSDLLNETKGFKYQITVTVLLKKKKQAQRRD